MCLYTIYKHEPNIGKIPKQKHKSIELSWRKPFFIKRGESFKQKNLKEAFQFHHQNKFFDKKMYFDIAICIGETTKR